MLFMNAFIVLFESYLQKIYPASLKNSRFPISFVINKFFSGVGLEIMNIHVDCTQNLKEMEKHKPFMLLYSH